MTISEIAGAVGVCKATVSLILNGKGKEHHISDRTIRLVQDYCRSINYRPNIHAVRMGRKIVGNIMLLLHSGKNSSEGNIFEDWNVGMITGGIASEVRKYNSSFTIRTFEPGMDGEEIFNCFRNREVDGMIYYGLDIPASWLRVFRQEQCKVVGIGIRPCEGISTVNVNNREISRTLTEYLIHQGCRRFLYFAGLESSYPGPERYDGFCEALIRHGIDPYSVRKMEGLFDENTAFKLMDNYCCENRKLLPDAILCANDSMAIGVIHALQKHSVRVPEQIRVTGGDNIAAGSYVTPALTTFENLPGLMGMEAVNVLHRQISGNGRNHTENLVLESRIIQRDSA